MNHSKFVVLAVTLPSLLLCACGKDSNVQVGSGSGQQVVVKTYMPVGEVKDPVHGKEVWLSYGALAGVGKEKANGIATMHVFEDSNSNIGIQLNIALEKEGTFYEAWVAKPNSAPSSWISVGHVGSVLGDVRHAVSAKKEQDVRDYSEVKITLENDDGNTAPSTVVAEGVLKKANR